MVLGEEESVLFRKVSLLRGCPYRGVPLYSVIYCPLKSTRYYAVLRAENVPLEDLEDSYVFPDAAEATGLALVNGSSASITLPNQLLRNRMTGVYIFLCTFVVAIFEPA